VYWLLRERSNVRHAAEFHVNTDEERAEILRLGVTTPVEVIPLGIAADASEAPAEPNWIRERCPQAGNRPILLYLSRVDPKKGVTDFLLPALARMKTDTFLAIVGGEDEHNPGYVPFVESEVARLGLGQRVALLGPVTPERRWAAYDGADVFVLPSYNKNFSFVAAEAMARGKQAVVTNDVEFGAHIVRANAGAVVRPHVGELAGCLDQWLSDPPRRALAGQSGRKYLQDHFTWRHTAEGPMSFYRRVLGS
jgi:glycosyltransferase involved in cell wall biosynthesis